MVHMSASEASAIHCAFIALRLAVIGCQEVYPTCKKHYFCSAKTAKDVGYSDEVVTFL